MNNIKEQRSIFDKYYLSTEGYYFMYRHDKNDPSIWRVSLYSDRTNERVDDLRVSEGYGIPEQTHHGVINHFEARLFLGQVK